MSGDARVRHCTLCSLNVYNFAEMTRDEVHQLIAKTEGRICARLYQRADGTVLTRDCPTGLRALRRRASRIATALIAMLLSLPAFALGAWKKPRLRTHGSKVKIAVERVTAPQPAVFQGVVRDQDGGNPIPGVTVVVRDEITKREITVTTDVNGAFEIASLSDGLYRVEVTLEGLKPARIEHLQLKASEVTQADVTLRMDHAYAVTVGVLVVDPMTSKNISVSTTFSQDFINKLPR